ncbi:hypothetical protein PAPYR_12516 [Paratrimastix pyriformis]|uniref:AAA+ ATPase domain-containing protein n=1 Tax=Paratrimastix pyriformis TaxID=342808 RepID=A0ABQ8U413_9EUKA|nr:hypothetical protein PAPYR_12516 [Paratrimastix pyriformis]
MSQLTPRIAADEAEFLDRNQDFDWDALTSEPFTCLIYGSPRSGKSYLLRWLLSTIASRYDLVYVFSISSDAIGYYDEVGIDRHHVMPGFDSPASRNLLKHMIETANTNVAKYIGSRVPVERILPRTLIICDDIISPGGEQHHLGALKSLSTNYRHLNMSLILTTQYVNEVNKVMRETVDYHILFKHESKTALDYFAAGCFAWAHWKPSVQYLISNYTGDHKCIIVNKRAERTAYTVFKAPAKNEGHECESAGHDPGDKEIRCVRGAAENEFVRGPDESGRAGTNYCGSADIVVSRRHVDATCFWLKQKTERSGLWKKR